MRYASIAASVAGAFFLVSNGAAQDVSHSEMAPPEIVAPPEPQLPELRDSADAGRGVLGIKVSLRARDTDSLGAYVDAVIPGGPADKAGIRSGDIITRLDGQSLVGGGAGEGGRLSPGLRLVRLTARLAPNDTVAVELLRGKERETVSVVTAEEPDLVLERLPGDWGRKISALVPPPIGPMPIGPGYPRLAIRNSLAFIASPLADLQIAKLNPDLGQYFGVSEGILVISAPKESKLGLKGGDVILSVDGRKPTSPGHLMRILGSYEPGERFSLAIVRNQKRLTLSAELDDKHRLAGRDRPHR